MAYWTQPKNDPTIIKSATAEYKIIVSPEGTSMGIEKHTPNGALIPTAVCTRYSAKV